MKASKDMKYHFGLVGRIYPNHDGKRIIAINDGIYRKTYNVLVIANNERYQLSKTAEFVPAYQDRIDYLKALVSSATTIKNQFPFMYGDEVDSDVVSNAIANYKKAWNMFKKVPGTSVPTVHKKSYEQSYNTSAHYNKDQAGIMQGSIRFVNRHKLHLPIIGDIRFSGSPDLVNRIFEIEANPNSEIRITTVTISRDAVGRYFCTLLIASDEPLHVIKPHTNDVSTAGGVDVNLTNLCTTSSGKVYDNIKVRKKSKKKLAKKKRKASKKLARAKKEGRNIYTAKNYQKERKKVALLQAKDAAHVDNYLHVVAKEIVNNHDYIFVEDLKIKNLLKNHKLAFAISDVCWGKFIRILEETANKYHKVFMKVPPHNTTQTCSVCGHVCKGDEHIELGIEQWICPECGTLRLRDENSAIVIRDKGLALLFC